MNTGRKATSVVRNARGLFNKTILTPQVSRNKAVAGHRTPAGLPFDLYNTVSHIPNMNMTPISTKESLEAQKLAVSNLDSSKFLHNEDAPEEIMMQRTRYREKAGGTAPNSSRVESRG